MLLWEISQRLLRVSVYVIILSQNIGRFSVDRDHILSYLKTLKSDPRFTLFEKIGLFGSYATGTSDIFSDVDVAVKVDKSYLDSHDVWDCFDAINAIKAAIYQKFHLHSDVFDLESISPLKHEITKDIIYV